MKNFQKKFNIKNKLPDHQQGFTLLEAMVAIAIFTIVMVIGISALLNVNNTNKKSQNLRTIMDNLNFTMEDMSRNFKLGSYYHCVTPNDPTFAMNQPNDFLVVEQDCLTTGHTGTLIASLEPMLGIPSDPGYPGIGAANAQDQVVYWFDPAGNIDPNNGPIIVNGPDECTLKKSVDGGGTFVSILPPEIKVSCSASGFNVYNTKVGSYAISPRIIIRVSGKVVYKEITTPFSLETMASQRNVNIISSQ